MYFLTTLTPLVGQNLETVFKENPFKVSGGINARQMLFVTDNEASIARPYTFNISGNLNLSFLQFSFPFSFNFSNQHLNYSRPTAQPFNQFGMSPTYKWVTAHAGWRSMSFSPYTLSGHLFLGGGLELKPNDTWEVQAMFGRLLKPIEFNGNNTPAYRRWGSGIKVSRAHKGGKVTFISFNGWDEQYSLKNAPDSLIKPEANMVLSLQLEQELTERISVNVEGARSAHTRDIRSGEVQNYGESPLDGLFFITTRTSTDFYGAMKGSLNYKLNFATLGLNYERIDPGYKTLGAYFFNNDLRNITVSASTQLFKKKMNVSTNVGLQTNNLDGDKASESQRWVGSLNLSGPIGDKLNLNGSYSNFTSFTFIVPVEEQIAQVTNINYDSLNFTQLSNTVTAGANYKIAANKKRSHTLTMNGTYNKVSSKNGEGTLVGGTEMYNANTAYNFNFVPWKMNLQFGINGSSTIAQGNTSQILGGTCGISKPLFEEKISANWSVNYNETFREGNSNGFIIVSRVGLSSVIKEKHNVSLSMNYMNRQLEMGRSNDLTVSMSYSYSFSMFNKKKNETEESDKKQD